MSRTVGEQVRAWSVVVGLAATSCHALPSGPVAWRSTAPAPTEATFVLPSDPRVAVMGRADRPDPGRLRIGYPGVTLRLRFEGTGLALRVTCDTPDARVAVLVDGGEPRTVRLPRGTGDVVLARGVSPGPHAIDVVHSTETWQGIVTVRGFLLDPGARLLTPDPWAPRRMLFIGDSVTCGEAIDRAADCKKNPDWWDAYASYGMLVARALHAQSHLVCYGGRGLIRDWRGRKDVLNAPGFLDLAIADEAAPSRWDHAAYVPEAIVVSLGTNDFSLSIGDLPPRADFVSAYVAFARILRARYPGAHVFLTEGAIVNDEVDPGRPQKRVLREYIAETARLLDDAHVHVVEARHYAGDACDAHPTREQHAAMARDLEPVVREILGW